ncbi:uncharacterized protein LOC141661629 [Apium graveolens]|uniref:uncharacterized protein LOC141661629 n=1 Tax=Apium graveolens TaxID=4045 RepID=UPI003D7B49D4
MNTSPGLHKTGSHTLKVSNTPSHSNTLSSRLSFQWLKIGALVLLLRLNGRPSSITFQSYSVTVENIYAVEVSACPSLVEIKRLPNKVLRWCAGTDNNTMYTMVFSVHTLNDTTFIDDMYAGECQDSTSLNQDLIQGNLHSNFRHTRRKFLNFFIKFAF